MKNTTRKIISCSIFRSLLNQSTQLWQKSEFIEGAVKPSSLVNILKFKLKLTHYKFLLFRSQLDDRPSQALGNFNSIHEKRKKAGEGHKKAQDHFSLLCKKKNKQRRFKTRSSAWFPRDVILNIINIMMIVYMVYKYRKCQSLGNPILLLCLISMLWLSTKTFCKVEKNGKTVDCLAVRCMYS